MSQDAPKPRGRPPSREARRKALAAAHEILMTEGFGRLSIEAAAARAGVGKPTLYRHWANAGELAMAALMEGAPEAGAAPPPDLRAALRRQLTDLAQAFATTRGRQIGLALAAADSESEITRAFRNRVILSSREAGRALIAAAVARGEIRGPEAPEAILDMIYAPVFYRLLVRHLPLDRAFAEAVADAAATLLGARPQPA